VYKVAEGQSGSVPLWLSAFVPLCLYSFVPVVLLQFPVEFSIAYSFCDVFGADVLFTSKVGNCPLVTFLNRIDLMDQI
jgi:hypothetical protein